MISLFIGSLCLGVRWVCILGGGVKVGMVLFCFFVLVMIWVIVDCGVWVIVLFSMVLLVVALVGVVVFIGGLFRKGLCGLNLVCFW